jgi:hypothetical protein
MAFVAVKIPDMPPMRRNASLLPGEETYVRLGRTWFVLVQAEVDRPRNGDHIAFSVSKSTLLETAERLKSMNAEFSLARSDTALYFFDYDNHVFELDTTDLDLELAG